MSQPSPAARQAAASAPHINPLMYWLVVNTTRLPALLRGQHLEVRGREHIPPAGRLIIAGKHVSALDPFLIAQSLPTGAGARRIQFMTKKELFRGPAGFIISSGGSFPVDRSGSDLGAVRTALRVLQSEGTLGIFPEGTRGGGSLQGGAALLSLRGRAPVLPAGLRLDGKIWRVRFGEPIVPEGSVAELTTVIGEQLERLSGPEVQEVDSRE